MPGCGCAGSSCGCQIKTGQGLTITGIGTKADPFVLSATIGSLSGSISFVDSASVDFTVAGQGTPSDPMTVTATATRLPFPLYTTAGRPDATIVPYGTYFFDTTLSKPMWAYGGVWVDAAGVAVP